MSGFQQHLIVQRFPLRITARSHSKVSEAWSQMVRKTLFKLLFAPKWVFDLITKEIILSARTWIKDFVVTKRTRQNDVSVQNFSALIRGVTWGGGEGREELSVQWLQKEFTLVVLSSLNFNAVLFWLSRSQGLFSRFSSSNPYNGPAKRARNILTYTRLVSPRHQPTYCKRLPWRLQHERHNAGMCCAHVVNVWWPCGTIQHPSKGWAQMCNVCATMMRLAAFKYHKRLAKH